jgi:tRNA pseudouridine55 synthase
LLVAFEDPTGATVVPTLEVALEQERARTLQVPPAYSAIHAGGERAFVRARRGEDVTLPARPVLVHRLDLAGWSREPAGLSLSLEVSKGYYVRALARDLAQALGTVAHLCSLRRTRSGEFTNAEAVSPEAPADVLRSAVIPIAIAATRSLPPAHLNDEGVRDARHGRPIAPADITASSREPSAWLDSNGALVAVGVVDETGRGTVLRGFREATASSSAPSTPSRPSPELP